MSYICGSAADEGIEDAVTSLGVDVQQLPGYLRDETGVIRVDAAAELVGVGVAEAPVDVVEAVDRGFVHPTSVMAAKVMGFRVTHTRMRRWIQSEGALSPSVEDLGNAVSRRNLLYTAAAAAASAGCLEETSREPGDDGGRDAGDEAEQGSPVHGVVVNVSHSSEGVRVHVSESGRAVRVTVEVVDGALASPEDLEDEEGEVVGEIDLVAGEHAVVLSGDREGEYAVVAADSDGRREVVASFTLPQ